ncbi:diguanylate cyclase [Roseateles sp. GG27B]
MTLDVPTLLVVLTAVALLMAFWVAFMAWGQPLRDALWAWTLALLSFAASHVLFGLAGIAPQAVVVVGGNMAYAVALALMLLALRRFQGLEVALWSGVAPVLLVATLFAALQAHYRLRIGVGSLMFLIQIGLVLQALLDKRHVRHGRGRFILMGAFITLGLTLLMRATAACFGWIDEGKPVQNGHWMAFLLLVALGAVVSITLGFVYMTMERAELRNFELAMKDMLTGLSNRRAISDQLHMAVSLAQRQGQFLSVLMLDIDHFKRINDSYGHQAGDVVLSGVAQTLASRLRVQDQIGRFGGEEFLVILPDTGLEGALTLAEALRAAVESTPTQWGAHAIQVTISIGVRGGALTGADTADSLVGAADAALYRAKQGGRNRVCRGEERMATAQEVHLGGVAVGLDLARGPAGQLTEQLAAKPAFSVEGA